MSETEEKVEKTDEIMEEARKQGWVPEDEWKGDPDKWRPAEEFVERGKNIIPILNDRLAKTEQMIETLVKTQKAELERVKKEQGKVAFDRAKADFDRELQKLKDKQKQAVQEADVDAYNRVEDQISRMQPPEPPPEQQNTPFFDEWTSKNPWYAPDIMQPGDADVDLTAYANGIAARMHATGTNYTEKEFYEEVEKQVRKTFPQKFTNPNKDKADIAEGGERSSVKKGKKTWADVPENAKKTFYRLKDKVEKAGGTMSKEDYAKQYFEEE